MSFESSTPGAGGPALHVGPWVRSLPDGAVSVAAEGESLVLRASDALQRKFESLLQRHKAGTLTADEQQQYEAICELDDALSWLNRLARHTTHTE